MKSYLVIWSPVNDWPCATVAELRVIDAFATDGGIAYARETAFAKRAEYAAKHGDGFCRVVAADLRHAFRAA